MPELASPGWLIALLLVPLVYLLHRFRAAGRPLPVPAIFLWREAATAVASGPRIGPPDPAWRRRALLVCLLVLTLSDPLWVRSGAPQIRVWLDDGPALFAREDNGRPRIEVAAELLAQALEEAGATRVIFHALRRPGQTLEPTGLDPGTLRDALNAWLPEPGSSPPVPLAGGEGAWLVSANVDPRVDKLLATTRFSRIVPIGSASENLALIGLAVRPAPEFEQGLTGSAEVLNAGRGPASRELELRLDGTPFHRSALRVESGGRTRLDFRLPAGASGQLEAVLLPSGADALSLDDSLVLDLAKAAAPLAYVLQGDCPPNLHALLAVHPGLRPAVAGDADLRIRCDPGPPDGQGAPALWLLEGPPAGPLEAAPVWSHALAGDRWPALDPDWIDPVTAPSDIPGGVLLGAGDRPLILEQEDPPRIVLLFDTANPTLAARPELPALLSQVLDRLAGRELLAPVAAAVRDPADALVEPRPVEHEHQVQATGVRTSAASPWLLGAALLLAVYDLVRQLRPGATA